MSTLREAAEQALWSMGVVADKLPATSTRAYLDSMRSLRDALAAPSPSPSSAPRPDALEEALRDIDAVCVNAQGSGLPAPLAPFVYGIRETVRRALAAPASPQPAGARLPSGRLAEPDALREIRRRYTGHGVIHALAALLDAANDLAPENDPDKYDGWRRLVVSARAEYDELWKVAASPQGERERARLAEVIEECAKRVEALAAHTSREDEEQAAWLHAWGLAAEEIRALAASSPHYAEKGDAT